MRTWIAIVLAVSIALSALLAAGNGGAMAGPGCAGMSGHPCPCDRAPKSCATDCATTCAQIVILARPVLLLAPKRLRVAMPPARETALNSLAVGVDPPVPRA